MQCLHCKGKMIEAYAPYSANRQGYHVAWDAVGVYAMWRTLL